MGILRDALSQAFASDQPQNGFNGPRMPFSNKRTTTYSNPRYSNYGYAVGDTVVRPQSPPSYRESQMNHSQGSARAPSEDRYEQRRQYYQNRPESRSEARDELYQSENYNTNIDPRRSQQDFACDALVSRRNVAFSDFRPLILPQVTYGDGEPFLRGYSEELERRGVTRTEFFGVLDAINVAIVPNPEVQIFQKAASIGGWFIPGAASLGLAAGQVGVGIANKAGHVSAINKVLSKANVELFMPHGLEICIASTQHIDAELGVGQSTPQNIFAVTLPENRIAAYGNLVAPLSEILPPQQRQGRNDPIAFIGKGLGAKQSRKKMEDAQKDAAEGKSKKMNSIENGLKWLMVRRASADARAHWQTLLTENDATFQQE